MRRAATSSQIKNRGGGLKFSAWIAFNVNATSFFCTRNRFCQNKSQHFCRCISVMRPVTTAESACPPRSLSFITLRWNLAWVIFSSPFHERGKWNAFPKSHCDGSPTRVILTKPSVSGVSPNLLCTHALSRNGRVEALTKPSKSVTVNAENRVEWGGKFSCSAAGETDTESSARKCRWQRKKWDYGRRVFYCSSVG